MQETELVRGTLPREFIDYVNSKLENGTGREHLCKELGSMDSILDLLRQYFETGSYLKTARKFNSSKGRIYYFIQDISPYLDEIKAYIRYEDEIRPRDFSTFPIIEEWERKIRRSGKLSQLSKIPAFKRACGYKGLHSDPLTKGFKCKNPERFDLEKAQELVDVYLKENPDKVQLPHHFRLAIRHFLQVAKGIHIPRGFGGQYGLSGDKGRIGKYAHVRLTEDQIEGIRKIIDNDPSATEQGFNIGYDIGIDTCSRAFAIGSISLKWIPEEIPEDATRIAIRVFEPKVKEGDEHFKKRGLIWKKYILKRTWLKIQRFLSKHDRSTLLFVERESIKKLNEWLAEFREYMRGCYEKLGVRERYFYDHPLHGLRHAGAQRLLEITGWNYGLVARLGGWKSEDTLRNWYGAMPDHIVERGAEQALRELAQRG